MIFRGASIRSLRMETLSIFIVTIGQGYMKINFTFTLKEILTIGTPIENCNESEYRVVEPSHSR